MRTRTVDNISWPLLTVRAHGEYNYRSFIVNIVRIYMVSIRVRVSVRAKYRIWVDAKVSIT